MKYNQYAKINTTHEQQIDELQQIKLLPENFMELDFTDLIAIILGKMFPEAKSLEAKKEALTAIALDTKQNLFDFVETDAKDLSQKAFYNVALQLLGYFVEQDYSLDNPIELFIKNNLPYLKTEKINIDNLINAFYLLLNTRTKNGQILIDILAGKGYFTPWFVEKNPKFLYFNGKSLPVFDTNKIIREIVYVESDLDTDHDGQKDLLQVTIFRPKETNENLKVPVLYTANPYFGGTNDVDKKLDNVDVNLSEVTEHFQNHLQPKPNLLAHSIPNSENVGTEEDATRNGIYTLNDYMLARGFANVYAGGIGTFGSDGVRICGAPEETICAKEIIEWLTGDRIAYTNRDRTTQTKAWWSNKKIAMTGKSYLGTLATAVAATGVKGLQTVISEAAISSWYDYYREHGLVIAPVLCQGEDTDVLAELCQSNFQQSTYYLRNKKIFDQTIKQLKLGQDRTTGQYNDFWDVRNYRHNTKNIKCSFVAVHGLNDWNVKPKNVYKLWQELQKAPTKHKLFLHQGPHTYMNNLASIDFTDMMNLWLTNELLDVKNNAMIQWPDVLIQDNLEADNWHSETTWNNNLGKEKTYQFTETHKLEPTTTSQSTILSFTDVGGKQYHEAKIGELEWEQEFLQGDQKWLSTQIRFTTTPLTQQTTIVGRPKVKLQVSSSLNKGQISVALVDLDTRKRLTETPVPLEADTQALGYNFGSDTLKEFKPGKTLPAKLIAKGHCNLQNFASLTDAKPILADQFYQLEFKLQPTYVTLPKGAQIGLIIYSTDMGMTKRSQETIKYQLDLSNSELTLFEKEV